MLKHKAFIAILIAAASIATAAVKFQMDQDKPFTFTWKGYDDAWKKVDSLEEKGLPRSAQDVVEVILEHAHTDKNGPQQIKAVTYIAKYALETEDDGFTLAQDMYKKEIAASTSPVKNILSSMLAGLYLEYYGSEAYILEGRTSVQENTSDDPNTWDIKTLYKKILEQTDASVADRELLKSIRAEDYALILENTTSFSYSARPTLYDLLGHRAMDLYMALGDMQAGPTAQVLTNPVLFADNKSFAGYAFSFDNTAQDKYIEMMQQLTLVHINDAPADPGIYLLLDRLDYMHNNYSADGVDEKYLQALYQAEKTYAKDTSSTWFTYQIAEWYHTQAAQYNRLEGEAHKWDNKTAILMCDSAIAKFPNTSGAKNAAALKDAIQFPTLHASVEEVNIPDKPFRVSVRYTNTQKVYFKLVQVSDAELKEINDKNGQDYLKQITKLKPIRTWSENIPDDGDHNEHVVELKVDALTPGRYFLVSSSNEKFSIQHSETNVTFFDVSNIGYISTDRYAIDAAAGGKLYYAVNRTSGEAVADATVKISTMKWVGKEYKEVLLQTLTTDREGKFVVPTPTTTEYMSFWFKIGKGTDTAYSSGSDYISNYTSNQPKEILNTLFFTDRSIYRPGQTVYYKGIVYNISADKKTKTVVPAHTTQVIFYDVNSQKVGEAELTTNDYGSFNGSFTIPGGVLTGMMRIQNEESSIYFSVEEYKRPTFSVEMQALEGSYVLNDSVFAKGIATTYSGAPVAGAKVQYRVTRNVFVPYYYRYAKSFPAYTDGVDIISGTSTTDAEGNFTIPFIALPGDGKDALQEYTYTVRADITDISGETRSGARSVSIGKKSMQMYADMDETLSGDSNVVITVHTENLNGVHVPVAGALTIYGLQGPGHILRSRRWEEPDKFIMTKTEYTSFFPNDIYAHENDISTWASKGVAAALTFNTADIDKLELPTEGLQNGMYRFVFSARDKNGEEISAEYFIEIKDGKGVSDVAKALTLGLDKTVYHPGENAILQVGSSIPGANVLFAVSKESNKRSYERFAIPIEHNKRNIYTSIDMEIDVTENDRGGFYVSACLFYLNDFYTENEFVQVPWDNKQLHVSLETHRDKLSPGSKETWKVTISGPQGEKVAAEMLASMYDASLDALTSHIWNDVSWPGASGSVYMIGNGQGTRQSYYSGNFNDRPGYIYRYYHDINSFGLHFYGRNGYYDGMVLEEVAIKSGKENKKNRNADADGENVTKFVTMKAVEDFVDEKLVNNGVEGNNTMGPEAIQTRSNLNETAFFYPELHTDAEGNIVFEFTIPEALTTWNFMAFAHDKEMRSGQLLSSVITQKELMIQPNMPRFLRAGDTIDVRAKISNLTENVLDGSAYLELYNALNMERVDAAFALQKTAVSFHTDAKGNAAVEWHIIVPEGYEALLYKVKAKAGDFTDGEENALPVLTNRILITEALPLWVRGQKQSDFQFTHLLQSDAEKGIVNRQLSLEYTSNPAWYAVQALPYMMEYPYECAEQLFNRFYSNAIGYYITQSNPNIKRTFDQWKNDPEALTSNLEKNEDLKSLLLQETPWVLQAQDESARKKRVALLFDENTMNNSLQSAMQKLSAMQQPDGGFPWFKGYESDRYITQYIVTGIAHLKSLGIGASDYPKMNSILDRSIVFCDEKMKEDYKWLEKNNVDKKTYVPGNITVQYLYARSYFKEYALDLKYKEAYDYYLGRIKSEWKKYGLYEQGMIALIMQRTGNTSTANDIVKSLKEYSQRSDEMGMWWKNNTAGYYWNQAPVETQALMIEVFDEVAHDAAAVEDLQVWLLRQKQTGDWKTTRATAEACYALLAWGEDLLDNNQLAAITLGGMLVQPEDTEAGTGYFRMNWMGGDVHANMGNVSITPPEKNTLSYGALDWQYFQDLDKVKRSGNDIQIQKELYLTKNTATGPELIAINEKTPLHVGDLVTVRMIITSDRKLEYVHLKDMRASLFEPVNVLSGYKWQGGLGYYEATGDAATNFFIAYMDKSTYVFEYPLRVAQTGNCSNGVASIQCMYAPEFVSYSEGRRVVVK